MNKRNIYNRRSFIQNSSVLAGGIILTPLIAQTDYNPQKMQKGELHWYQKPLRIMQTVLREIDARDYDAKAVVDYLKKTLCNALVVNAGGITDFFQNPLPAANINPFMGTRDILMEITGECHANGIKIIARVDFRGVEEHIYRRFPGWFMRNAANDPVINKSSIVPLYISCYSGYHRNEYANQFVNYLMKHYDVDGIWHNSPVFEGICYCTRCKEGYLKATGKSIPFQQSSSDGELDQYMEWKAATADNYMDKLKKTVKSYGDDKAYCAEIFSIYGVERRINSGIDLTNARSHFDFLVSVAFLTGPTDPVNYYCNLNYATTIVRFLKSMVPEREAIVLYGENGTSHRLVIDPPIDLNIWLWEILSVGGRFWNCYFAGQYPGVAHDRRNAYNNLDAYRFVEEHEEILTQQVPVANIGVYYSKPTRLSYRLKTDSSDIFGTELRGIINVLTENHLQYDFILDDQMSGQMLKKYNVIILPNVRCMSDTEVNLIKDYVREGGSLIATFSTSLYGVDGGIRNNFGLSDLFGVEYSGDKLDTRVDNYQYIVNPSHHIVISDSFETEFLFNSGYTLLCKPRHDAEVICSLTPIIRNQPPDKSWVDKFSTDYPTIVENSYGKGKVIYFANQPDTLAYTVAHPDMMQILLRSIRYLLKDSSLIETTAPESVHIGLTRSLIKEGMYVLSLVNLTSGPVRPVRSLIPVHNIRLSLRLEGQSINNNKVLRSQGSYKIKTKGTTLELGLSKLEDFCAVMIQMKV